jgi:hypothetical protein
MVKRVAMPRAGRRGAPLDQAAGRGQPSLSATLHPRTRDTKECSRASANSTTWRLRGVRYLFPRGAKGVRHLFPLETDESSGRVG